MNKKHMAWGLVAAGAVLGLADAYYSGNLAAAGLTPTTPNTTNTFSTINNFLPVPTSFLLVGAGLYLMFK